MAFTPTTWSDGTTAITAAELNRMETGIDEAHVEQARWHAGLVDEEAGSGPEFLPAGWTIAYETTYVTVTHNLATTNYMVQVQSMEASAYTELRSVNANTFEVFVLTDAGGTTTAPFSFILVEA